MPSTWHPTLSILIQGVLFLRSSPIVVVATSIFLSRNLKGLRCLRKKHGLENGRGDTLGFLKGRTCVNRELLTNKVNQLRRGMNNIDSVHSLYKAGEGCGIHVSEGGFLDLRPSWRPELNCGQSLKSSCRLE